MFELVLFVILMGWMGVMYGAVSQRLDEGLQARWPHHYRWALIAGQAAGALAWWAGVLVLDGTPAHVGDPWPAFWPLAWMAAGNIGLVRSARWHLWGKRRHDQAERHREAHEEHLSEAVHVLRWAGCRVEWSERGWYEVTHPTREHSLLDGLYDPAELLRLAEAARVMVLCQEDTPRGDSVILAIPSPPSRPGWSIN